MFLSHISSQMLGLHLNIMERSLPSGAPMTGNGALGALVPLRSSLLYSTALPYREAV